MKTLILFLALIPSFSFAQGLIFADEVRLEYIKVHVGRPFVGDPYLYHLDKNNQMIRLNLSKGAEPLEQRLMKKLNEQDFVLCTGLIFNSSDRSRGPSLNVEAIKTCIAMDGSLEAASLGIIHTQNQIQRDISMLQSHLTDKNEALKYGSSTRGNEKQDLDSDEAKSYRYTGSQI